MATHAARSAPLSASLRARRAAPRATLLAVSNGAHLPAERKDELRQTAELVGRAGKVRTARHAHGTAVGGGMRQQSARCCAAGAEACALRPERGVGRTYFEVAVVAVKVCNRDAHHVRRERLKYCARASE